jgi:hypothetical protein
VCDVTLLVCDLFHSFDSGFVRQFTQWNASRKSPSDQRSAETPHEIAFQQTYGKMIASTLEALRNPTNPECPNASWLLFKQVRPNTCVCVIRLFREIS